ncbi:MAG: hypothetical protein P1U86_20715 [Verrucomicrobiales bacterium]|nr:hypothetical protein [Verrucomicrobiales bacterium]
MSAAAEIQPMFFDEDGGNDLEIQFDPKQFEAVTPYTEDLNDEYQQAQDQLRQLRQQEEQIKRQAAELEELTQKEEQFKTGRTEVCEDLTSYLAILERESNDAQRIVEDCAAAQERLDLHLSNINALRPETWSRADRKAELARALSYVEAAEDEIDSVSPLIDGFGKRGGLFKMKASTPKLSQSAGAHSEHSFSYWVKSGLAFSLPFVGFGIIAFLISVFS